MSKPSVHIIYGFGEDGWNGIGFRRTLLKAGFSLTADAQHADIVVAHSAGCFYLPDTTHQQLTVLIGPPYWPGSVPARNSLKKFWLDFRAYTRDNMLKAWLVKTVHNTLYVLGGLRKAIWIARNAGRHDFYLALRNKNVCIIRPEYDAYLTPDAENLLRSKADFRFAVVAGHQHDDCWRYPGPYIDLIQSLYG